MSNVVVSAGEGPNATTQPMAMAQNHEDPFAAQRSSSDNTAIDDSPGSPGLPVPKSPRDRRQSTEWDASKVPPSQFQKRKGSIYAVPGSRDSHIDSAASRDKNFHEKLKEKGWLPKSKK